jgi:hypothetical protein
MRVLLRVVLTLLVAVPIVLGLLLLFALQGARGRSPASEAVEPLSSGGVGLGSGQLLRKLCGWTR